MLKSKTAILKGIGLTIALSSIIAISCTKDKESKACRSSYENKDVYVNDKLITGQSFRRSGDSVLKITYLHIKPKNYFKKVLDDCPININSVDIIGIALFYPFEIQNKSDLKNSIPSAVIIYNKIQNKIITSCYFKNSNNSFSKDNSLTGITSVIAANDFYNIDDGADLKSKEIITLFDTDEIPPTSYVSDFQIKTSNFAKQQEPGDGDIPKTLCSIIPECVNTPVKGTCCFRESQNGPVGGYCVQSSCATEKTINLLIAQGNYIKPEVTTNIYRLRDGFLNKSINGSIYIDNFYFASTHFEYSNLNTNFLLSSLKFFNSNLVIKLGNINNSLYKDSILINSNEKALLLDIISNAKSFTNNTRFNNILLSVEADINKYTNKKISEIKYDF